MLCRLLSSLKCRLSTNPSPLQLFQQHKLHYQHTSDLLSDPNFFHQQQQKIGNQQPVSIYCGYDPTADSLHLGNLVSIVMMARMQYVFGVRPIFLLGGATGLIGDPSGKKEERDLLAEERVQHNLQCIKSQIQKIYQTLTTDIHTNPSYNLPTPSPISPTARLCPLLINNHQFYKKMPVLTYLREIGKLLRMSSLLQKQLITSRLQSQAGISYTEFSYSILQAYDFYMLNSLYGCVLQFGGSDQWGNITNGCDLIKRKNKGVREGFGVTMPLLLNRSGQKFGKSQGNALFLNSTKTPTGAIYDYLFNTSDDQLEKLLSIFTFYSPQRITEIMKEHQSKPELRIGQKILAERVTSWLGSYKNYKEQLLKISEQDLRKKRSTQLTQIYNNLSQQLKTNISLTSSSPSPSTSPSSLVQLLVALGMHKSRNQARKDLQGQGVYINNSKVRKEEAAMSMQQVLERGLLQGGYILFRKGKKKCVLVRIMQ